MAVLALPNIPQPPSQKPAPKAWSFNNLLDEIGKYLWRYGTATDVETDPIELLDEARKALTVQESLFEKEQAEDLKEMERLRAENAAMRAKLAKVPAWWRG